jgi:Xaa-Pro aminopeptidase
METKLTNRVTMFKTVTRYLDDNSAAWNTMTPMQAAVTDLKSKIASIDATAQQQEAPNGATDDKAEARDTLEDVLFLACEALGVLAHTSNDNDLLALTDVTRTSLHRMGAEELSNRAASVATEANARKTELAMLHVTQANLDELNEALEDFNSAKSGPRTATAARAVQTQSLPRLVREASNILRNRIDRMTSLFRRSNPDFVSGYQIARVIVDRAATHGKSTHPIPAPTPTPSPINP